MKVREAFDAFEVATRAELIKRLAVGASDASDTVSKIDDSLAEGRKATFPLIRAVFGEEVAANWIQTEDEAMTPTHLRHCIDTIGWSQRQLARVLDRHEGTVRQWARGSVQIPGEVAAWLEALAAAHEANPPPRV